MAFTASFGHVITTGHAALGTWLQLGMLGGRGHAYDVHTVKSLAKLKSHSPRLQSSIMA